MIPLSPPMARLLGSTRFVLAVGWVLGLGVPLFGYAAVPEFWVAPSGSDAWQKGFQKLPLDPMELRRDPARSGLPPSSGSQ